MNSLPIEVDVEDSATLEEYLEKYTVNMNQNEISEISDSNIRNIKMKYWDKKHKAFLNEREIQDTELGNEFDRIEELEKKELEDYYSEYKMRHTNPKHAIVEQETEMLEDMTEGQLAEYLAENFNDY